MGGVRMLRLKVALVLVAASLFGCENGSSTGPARITFTPPAPPAGTGFVALYAPPVDVGPYPNDLYNPTGTKLEVPVRVTSPLASAQHLSAGRHEQRGSGADEDQESM